MMARAFVASGFLFLGGAFTGCTAISHTTAQQCHSEDDCRSRGPEFANTTCSAERICVPVSDEQQQCSTNQQCSDQHDGTPWRCLPTTHQCVPITSAECPKIFGEKAEYTNDNAIFVGMSYPNDVAGFLYESGAELARSEIQTIGAGGLPAAVAGGPVRPLVIVGCPNNPLPGLGSVEAVAAGARHLINLGAVASIGPQTSTAILTAVKPILLPADIAVFLSGSSSSIVAPDPHLTLMGAYFDSIYMPTTIKAVEDFVEEKAIAAGAPRGKVKIQVFGSADPFHRNMVQGLISELRWNNGKKSSDPENSEYFKFTSTGNADDPLDVPATTAAVQQAIATLKEFQPHIVLMFANPPQAGTFAEIEKQWPTGVQRPYFVVENSFAAPAQAYINSRPGPEREAIRQRVFAVTTAPRAIDQKLLDLFEVAVVQKFPQFKNVGKRTGAALETFTYNSVYTIALSIVSAGATQLSGEVIARGVNKLTSGTPVIAGLNEFTKGADVLKSGGSIQLQFMNGPFSLNEQRQFLFANGAIQCMDGTGEGSATLKTSTYRYDTLQAKSTGAASLNCP